MFPVLITVGDVAVSSFGFFLALAFLFGTFLVWRLARAWDMDEERILDLTLLTFLGGLIGARAYFILEHFEFFGFNLLKMLQIIQYPGFSFWGGFLGGWLTLFFLTRRQRLDFWQVADLASIGFLGGLVLGNIGCLLGGCNLGVNSNLFFAVSVVGVIGKRFPVAGVEALLLAFVLWRLWAKATHFHLSGQIASLVLIYIGLVKFITEFFRAGQGGGYLFAFTLIVLGIASYYRISKKSFMGDLKDWLKFAVKIITDNQTRKIVLMELRKNWYNFKVKMSWRFRQLSKLLRRLNVKPTPKDIRHY